MCVYSVSLQVAGTLDALGAKDGKIILIDWKTSNGFYEDMALQCGGYVCCLEEMTGQTIDEGWIVRFDKRSPLFEAKTVDISKAKSAFKFSFSDCNVCNTSPTKLIVASSFYKSL